MKTEILVLVSILVSAASFPFVIRGLEATYHIAQAKEMKTPLEVTGNMTLRWDLFPEPTIAFVNCSGFLVSCNNAVLDLNGHSVLFKAAEKSPGAYGVLVEGKHGVTIRNGTIIGFQQGIYVRDSSEISIVNNTVTESANTGIGIERKREPTFNIFISGNTILNMEMEGVWLNGVDHANISRNTVSSCYYYGVSMVDSSNCTLSGNIISNNDPSGIYMDICSDNSVINNTLQENTVGLKMEDSSSNVICHNDFVENANHVEISGSTNSWNYDYPCGGNYWSNYGGEDNLSGVDQSVSFSDGIGDRPYILDENNRDKYPLVDPWGTALRLFDITWQITRNQIAWNISCPMALFSNSSITDFYFDKKSGRMSFTANNGTFCKAIVAKELLEGAFNCSVDYVPTPSSLYWDETHAFVDLTYNNKSHRVEIVGEIAMRIPGDLDNNGVVNIIDITLAAKNFGETKG